MRKIKFMSLLLITLLAGGCVKYDLKMGVNTDKSFNLKIINAIQTSYYSASDYAESTTEYQALGYEVENYEDDSYKGISLNKNFNSIDEISSPTCGSVELTELLEKEVSNIILFNSNKKGTTTTYTAKFTYDLTQETEESTVTSGSTTETTTTDYSEYASSMYFNYIVTLPSNAKIISNNADTTENNGHTLSWKMEYGKLKNIDFVFTIDDKDVTETPLDEEKEKDEDLSEEPNNEEETQVNTTKKDNNKVSRYIIIGLIIAVIVLGLLAFKIKINSNSKTSSDTIKHTNYPYNDKNKK